MSESTLSFDVLQARRIEEVCERFEDAWLRGGQPHLHEYLGGLEEADRAAALGWLLDLDAHNRSLVLGERPEPAEYHKQFPELASVVNRVFGRQGLVAKGESATGTVQNQCLTPSQIVELYDATLSRQAESPHPHLVACVRCREGFETHRFAALHSDLLAGARPPFGNYEFLEVIGNGGQGVVCRARQIRVNKEVALKLVNPLGHQRSLRELKLAANLEHAHLVRVYHVGEHLGQMYFTMSLAAQGNLAKHLDRHRLQATPPATAAEKDSVEQRKRVIAGFMAKIARAAHYLHQQRVLHRDLKPHNILIDAQGEPLVTDLGLARRLGDGDEERSPAAETCGPNEADALPTITGSVLGTPGYMAPEQAQGRTDLTASVDVYGLGAVLFELLTGRTPYVGSTLERIEQAADPACPAPPPSAYNENVGTGSDLELICRKCLAKDPNDRYDSAGDVADDLEHFVRDEEISLRHRSWLERAVRGAIKDLNHKLPVQGVARWGAIDLWDAGLNVVRAGALYALILTDQPPVLLWGVFVTTEVLWWWVFLTYLFRHDPVEPTERHLALIWGGVTLAGLTLLWIYCPPFGSSRAADVLAYYPPWTVVNGLAFLVVGRVYWGRYYLVGLAHFLVAILLPLRLDLAPLIYGLFVATFMIWAAADHFRAARGVRAIGSPG